MKKLLTLFIGINLFYSCKKEVKQNDNYIINGIHEISFGEQMSDTMSFSVDLIPGGAEEIIDLSIDGLPEDLRATFSKTSGTPTFTSLLTITRQESSAGTHYLNLIGLSVSGKRKAYPVKVVVPPLRDIRFDGRYYKVTAAINDSTSRTVFIRSGQQVHLSLSLPASLPNKAGTYKYRVTAALPDAGEAQLKFWLENEYFLPGYRGTDTVTLNIDTTRVVAKVYLPDIEITTSAGPIAFKNLGINYNK